MTSRRVDLEQELVPGAVLGAQMELVTGEEFGQASKTECNGSPPMSSPCVEPTIVHSLPAQLEMILTAWHLQTLARALGLPTTESVNQLRQCIKAVVQKDHGYHNVAVTVRESS